MHKFTIVIVDTTKKCPDNVKIQDFITLEVVMTSAFFDTKIEQINYNYQNSLNNDWKQL